MIFVILIFLDDWMAPGDEAGSLSQLCVLISACCLHQFGGALSFHIKMMFSASCRCDANCLVMFAKHDRSSDESFILADLDETRFSAFSQASQ